MGLGVSADLAVRSPAARAAPLGEGVCGTGRILA